MTAAECLRNGPSIEILENSISISALQFALLQQEYAPNHPVFSKSPMTSAPTAELAELNVGDQEIASDKVTLGDATSVNYLRLLLIIDSRRFVGSTFARAYAYVKILVFESFCEGEKSSSS